jgi:hypothetical protein
MLLILNIALAALILLLVITALTLLAATLTGRDPRAYSVLDADASLELAGEHLSADELAKRYQPQMKLQSATPSPPLLFVFYEIISSPTSWDIVYYNVWEDEINPNPFIHKAYRLFRAAYYGCPVRDIEYIQLNVAKQSGQVSRMRFETTPGEDYFVVFSTHLIAEYTPAAGGLYAERVSDKDSGTLVRQGSVSPLFNGSRPQVGAATWNHLSRLVLAANSTAFDQVLEAPLQVLSAAEYRSYKFVRKSQADYQTLENHFGQMVSRFAKGLLLFYTGYWLKNLFTHPKN